MPTWPSSLPTYPDDSGFTETLDQPAFINKPDIGPAKVRPRVTQARKTITVSYHMTTEQITTFAGFYMGSLTGGSVSFLWPHPRIGALVTATLTSTPNYSSVQYDWYVVNFELDVYESRLFIPELTDDSGAIVGSPVYPGVLINGAIDVSFSGGDLTVAIVAADGSPPGVAHPVYYSVGTRSVCLTEPLTLTREAGALDTGAGYWSTSWLHLAKGPVSGYEQDLFVYVGWHGTSNQPMLLVSREGWHTKNVFQNEGSGHGALWSIATNAYGPSGSLDPIAVCGRFSAILTTPNAWSSPNTFLLLQRPTRNTRMLTYNPHLSDLKSGTLTTAGYRTIWWYNFEGPWLNIINSTFFEYQTSGTISNELEFVTPISMPSKTIYGVRQAGIFGYGGDVDPNARVDYGSVYYHSSTIYTDRVRLAHTDRATLTTGNMLMCFTYREFMGWDDWTS